MRKERKPVIPSSFESLALRLAAHLDCTQDQMCQQILRSIAQTGQPLTLSGLASHVQMRLEDVQAHLAHRQDTEYDEEGKIVGWGITLVPTQHQFWVQDHALFTWCAFDTVLFPLLLQVEAHIQSECAASGQPISFVVTSEGCWNAFPATLVVSLMLPQARCDCLRGTFCQQSLFFQSEQVAAP
jgi:alkylmercury lyase